MGNTLGLAPMGTLPRRSHRREEPLPNPGSFDELHRLCKDVFPAQMEGVKLVVNKVLSSHFQVAHTVHMSALGLPGYHLHTAYAGDWQLSPTEVFPTVVGDMDSSGSLNAQVLLLLAERLRAKAVFQADMVFRGLVDSNWCVGAVLEKKMRPLPVTLALGAFLNHWRNRFHCGFSITVG